MPRYQYHCSGCDTVLVLDHLSTEEETDCPKCLTSGALEKMLTSFRPLSKKIAKQKKIGDYTEEFIRDARTELSSQKRDLQKSNKKDI